MAEVLQVQCRPRDELQPSVIPVRYQRRFSGGHLNADYPSDDRAIQLDGIEMRSRLSNNQHILVCVLSVLFCFNLA